MRRRTGRRRPAGRFTGKCRLTTSPEAVRAGRPGPGHAPAGDTRTADIFCRSPAALTFLRRCCCAPAPAIPSVRWPTRCPLLRGRFGRRGAYVPVRTWPQPNLTRLSVNRVRTSPSFSASSANDGQIRSGNLSSGAGGPAKPLRRPALPRRVRTAHRSGRSTWPSCMRVALPFRPIWCWTRMWMLLPEAVTSSRQRTRSVSWPSWAGTSMSCTGTFASTSHSESPPLTDFATRSAAGADSNSGNKGDGSERQACRCGKASDLTVCYA